MHSSSIEFRLRKGERQDQAGQGNLHSSSANSEVEGRCCIDWTLAEVFLFQAVDKAMIRERIESGRPDVSAGAKIPIAPIEKSPTF